MNKWSFSKKWAKHKVKPYLYCVKVLREKPHKKETKNVNKSVFFVEFLYYILIFWPLELFTFQVFTHFPITNNSGKLKEYCTSLNSHWCCNTSSWIKTYFQLIFSTILTSNRKILSKQKVSNIFAYLQISFVVYIFFNRFWLLIVSTNKQLNRLNKLWRSAI